MKLGHSPDTMPSGLSDQASQSQAQGPGRKSSGLEKGEGAKTAEVQDLLGIRGQSNPWSREVLRGEQTSLGC